MRFNWNTGLLVLALAARSAASMKVLVTGAGGRTGALVFEQLKSEKYAALAQPVGLARSKASLKKLRKAGAAPGEVISADITKAGELKGAMEGCEAVSEKRRGT